MTESQFLGHQFPEGPCVTGERTQKKNIIVNATNDADEKTRRTNSMSLILTAKRSFIVSHNPGFRAGFNAGTVTGFTLHLINTLG